MWKQSKLKLECQNSFVQMPIAIRAMQEKVNSEGNIDFNLQ